MSKITTDFAGTETQAVTVSRLTSILSAYGKVPAAYTTWGNARTDLNDLLTTFGQTTIGNFEVAGTFRPKLNWLNDAGNVIGALFRNGEAGAFYDPGDLSTLFQDSAGTTPVTAVEQPVGLMLDKSRGLVLGSELVTVAANREFSSDTGYWTRQNGTITISGGTLNFASTGNLVALYAAVSAIGAAERKYYEVTYTLVSCSAGAVMFGVGNSYTPARSAPGTYTERVCAGNGGFFGFYASGTTTASVDNISVRELPGAHASQSTSAARPTLRARYNLLTRTEEFDHSDWQRVNTSVTANAATAPNGTTTADLLFPTTTGTDRFVWRSSGISGAIGNSYTVSIIAKASGKSFLWFGTLNGSTAAAELPFFNLSTGQVTQTGTHFDAVTIQSLGDGWFRCVATKNAAASVLQFALYGVADASGNTTATTNGTDGILLWGASFLTAADQTATGGAYQRVGAATDYATGGVFRPYLAFDGSDDSMSTAAVDFSATDEMTMVAGVTKLSDASFASVVEFTANSDITAGSFGMFAPYDNNTATIGFQTFGTTRRALTNGSLPSPLTSVLTGAADVSAPNVALRRNGAQINSNTASLGAGNYSNASLFIGSRNNAIGRLNGRIYSLIVLGRTATAAEITATESWVNSRTGAY